jgi:hypothetical protein
MNPELRRSVLARDGHTCRVAGLAPGPCDGRVRLHHRQPRGRGGPDTAENLIAVCGGATGSEGHHGWIHRDLDGVSTRLGLLVSQYVPAPVEPWEPPPDPDALPRFGF